MESPEIYPTYRSQQSKVAKEIPYQWRFLGGKISEKWSLFQQAMFDDQNANPIKSIIQPSLNHHFPMVFPASHGLTTGVIPKMTAFSIERQDDPRW